MEMGEQKKYRSGTGKLLHMMRWSRPDNLNAVRELSKHMKEANLLRYKAMHRVMEYVMRTPKRGLTLAPNGVWDGSKDFEFIVKGYADSTYASDPDTRLSVGGRSVFLNDAPVSVKSSQQTTMTLSSAESELMSGTSCAQDMLYTCRILESLGLKVQKPMILYVDNRGAVELANNWTVGGRTRHIEVRQYFLRELKEQNVILTRWISGDNMCSDYLTKNLPGAVFEQHIRPFVGEDEYYAYKTDNKEVSKQ